MLKLISFTNFHLNILLFVENVNTFLPLVYRMCVFTLFLPGLTVLYVSSLPGNSFKRRRGLLENGSLVPPFQFAEHATQSRLGTFVNCIEKEGHLKENKLH